MEQRCCIPWAIQMSQVTLMLNNVPHSELMDISYPCFEGKINV